MQFAMFYFYFCRVRKIFFSIALLFLQMPGYSQDTTALSDTLKKDLFKLFQWKEKKAGEFEITVVDYDSLKLGNNDFQTFYYTAADKPNGKLTVRDRKNNKVRSCVYRNNKMFDERWWYPTGEKEFEGKWSEDVNAYGDQYLEEYKWYYRNKKVRKHGFRNGITRTYYNDGKIESEKTYRNGKASGPFKRFYPNGKPEAVGAFLDGNRTGEWIYYNPDGTVKEKSN